MEIALVDGVRVLPSPGAQGSCQACGAPMTAKCGEQKVWHWAHKGRRVCDPWWENEGEWHRAWKRSFPEDYHEVVQHESPRVF
ncbi:competence protein CoiA family protein [Pseudomonas sp.]|uniref:competence protein CoiA family protein n=1 Tax=Pseudomonas sp. TaxID=306 RepID=UPI00338F5665